LLKLRQDGEERSSGAANLRADAQLDVFGLARQQVARGVADDLIEHHALAREHRLQRIERQH
jgi:hypothetical protein